MLGEIGEHGRVVKALGDGFVVFEQVRQALAACIHVQNHLLEHPLRPGGSAPVELQIGIDSGEVVEIEGDCFGDTVNSAARLADLAGASHYDPERLGFIFPAQRTALRSMGPMYLRGKTESSHVYRVEWRAGQDGEATMIGRSAVRPQGEAWLELLRRAAAAPGRQDRQGVAVATDAALQINDPRVSRLHATLGGAAASSW